MSFQSEESYKEEVLLLAQVDFSFIDQLVDSFSELGRDIGAFIPRLVVALLLIIVGRWIARWVKKLTEQLLVKVGATKVVKAAGMETALADAGTSGPKLVSQVMFYLVVVVFLQIAAEVLGIDRITALLDTLISYLPLVIVAILLLFVAGAISNWAAGAVRPFAESRGMPWIDNVVRVAILVVGFLAAMDVLNFAPDVMSNIQNTLLQYLPLSVLVAFAISFGVGGIETGRKWWAKYLDPDTVGSKS